MTVTLKSLCSRVLARSPLALWPVRVRCGIAKGARWTLLPYSAYWRLPGENDVEAAIRSLGDIRGQCCWDLGAHFGIYSIGLALAVGPEGEVASFEPEPVAHARCARHIRMNGLHNIKLFNAAVGEKQSEQPLIISNGLGATTGHLQYEDEPANTSNPTVLVKIVALDSLVASGQIRPPVFAKVDVEGHGAKALLGTRETLRLHRPVLVMSFHSKGELEGTQAVLEPLGYRCFDGENQALTWDQALFRTAILRTQP